MKKYKLLKDTHKGKAGLLVVWDFGNECYFGDAKKDHFFSQEEVEDCPEWFENVSEDWRWDDDLVNEYVEFCMNHVFTSDGTEIKQDWFMEKFKSKKDADYNKIEI